MLRYGFVPHAGPARRSQIVVSDPTDSDDDEPRRAPGTDQGPAGPRTAIESILKKMRARSGCLKMPPRACRSC